MMKKKKTEDTIEMTEMIEEEIEIDRKTLIKIGTIGAKMKVTENIEIISMERGTMIQEGEIEDDKIFVLKFKELEFLINV